LLLTFGLLLSVLAACSGNESKEPAGTDAKEEEKGEKVLNFLNPEAIPSMDPSLATDESSFIYLAATLEGLYRLDEKTQPSPGIATKHEVSKDGLTWTFTLREDAKWSNGDPVTAHDFVYDGSEQLTSNRSEYSPYVMNGVIKCNCCKQR
jgi:oligopeptide transport system substrate-binding protein